VNATSGLSRFSSREAIVREFGRLDANWDGYDASPLSKTVTANAIRFLQLLEASNISSPDISPLANGTIAFEWQSYLGFAYLEIGNSRFSMVASSGGSEETLLDGGAEALGLDHAFLIETALFPQRMYATTINQITFCSAVAMPVSEMPRLIVDDEVIVRCIFFPHHFDKSGKIKSAAFHPKAESEKISTIRHDYVGTDFCKEKAKEMESCERVYKGLNSLSV